MRAGVVTAPTEKFSCGHGNVDNMDQRLTTLVEFRSEDEEQGAGLFSVLWPTYWPTSTIQRKRARLTIVNRSVSHCHLKYFFQDDLDGRTTRSSTISGPSLRSSISHHHLTGRPVEQENSSQLIWLYSTYARFQCTILELRRSRVK